VAPSRNPKGRTPGIPNKSTIEFKEALTNLLNMAAPNMIDWLQQTADKDPSKALMLIGNLVEYAHPKLARHAHEGGDPTKPIQNKLTVEFIEH